MQHKTQHTLSNGVPVTFVGGCLFDVTASTDDGQTASARIAADSEWKARTRLLAVQTSMDLRGQTVTYTVAVV